MKYDGSLMWHKIITQDEKVILREVLSVLLKSSPYAVSTERDESISVHLDAVKYYLYIKTDIENDLKKSFCFVFNPFVSLNNEKNIFKRITNIKIEQASCT